MNFRKIECISEKCEGKHIIMGGHGGHFSGRGQIVKVKCPECGLVLMIIPMRDDIRYEVTMEDINDKT